MKYASEKDLTSAYSKKIVQMNRGKYFRMFRYKHLKYCMETPENNDPEDEFKEKIECGP